MAAIGLADRAMRGHIGANGPDMRRRLIILALIACCALPAPIAAQGGPGPFEDSLARLSEILGALHYLRALCGTNEGQKWRAEMQALVDAEAPPGSPRRARMIAGFNRGYAGFEQTYRTCTPAADLAIHRYLEEGAKISREVTARYSN
jgi:uncharacterized protein (TIGR02301 family)